MTTTATVQSSDGVPFVVETHENAVAFERAFASTQTALQLEAHGDFVRVRAPGLESTIRTGALQKALAGTQGSVPGRRPALVLLQGGKS